METLNTIIAVLTLLGGVLCGRAFLPHIKILGSRPVDNLARGLLICALSAFPRTAFWDVVWTAFPDYVSFGIGVNLMFNGVMLIGLYYILRARWLTIPAEVRKHYNIFTAVIYPDTLFPRLRKED